MKRCVKTGVMAQMMELLTGDASRSMEAAKHLLSFPLSELEPSFLARVVSDSEYKVWSKVAAVYVLGFIPLEGGGGHEQVLRASLADLKGSLRVRTHAAEALGNLGDVGAVTLLGERMMDYGENTSVRRWCIYALGEIGSAAALEVLERFSATDPSGVLAEELGTIGLHAA